MTTNIFHGILANMTMMYFLLVSFWGYIRFFMKKGIDDSFRGALMIAEGIMILEVLVGGFLWISKFRPAQNMHLLYGALLPAIIPFIHVRTEGRDGRSEILAYATALLFSAGLILRANYTGEVPSY